MKRFVHKYYLVLVVLMSVSAAAKVPIVEPILGGNPTGIAPLYFGPNAFPIPDMLDGRPQGNLRVELAADSYLGYEKDWTVDAFARVHVPLFTRRVNLTLWMPVMEWYSISPERQQTCRLPQADSVPIRGNGAGDVYISTDIQLLRAKIWSPDITLRAAIKTASGGQFGRARHYDAPGYFFDLSIGKSYYFGHASGDEDRYSFAKSDSADWELRIAGSGGFLCWQTDNGRQNDAIMYGLQALVRYRYVSLQATWGGYFGWENYGDKPMSLKLRLAGHIKGFEPYVYYQWGIQDYPFHQVRVGLAYDIDVLKSFKGKKWQ